MTSSTRTPLAQYAIKQVRDGRRIGRKLNSNDVSSGYAQRRKKFVLKTLDLFDDAKQAWKEVLVEDKYAGPADTAASGIDFDAWLRLLPRRTRRVAETLAKGETTKTTAKRFRVSPGRISQLRRELQQRWQDYQSEPAFGGLTSVRQGRFYRPNRHRRQRTLAADRIWWSLSLAVSIISTYLFFGSWFDGSRRLPVGAARFLLTLSVGTLPLQPLKLPIFGPEFWLKATFTVAWGNAPGARASIRCLAEGHIHRAASGKVSMAFGQKGRTTPCSWGVAPGYGGSRPSAKHGRTAKCATSKTAAAVSRTPQPPIVAWSGLSRSSSDGVGLCFRVRSPS